MATASGTVQGVSLYSKAFSQTGTVTARDRREVWLVTADFPAYTGSTDTAQILAVGAAISARANDGRTRTIAWAGPAFAGGDTANQSVFFTGASVNALTVSGDNLTGNLSDSTGTELTSSTASLGVGTLVAVDVT